MEKGYRWLKRAVIFYLIIGTIFVHFFPFMEFGYKLLIFSLVNIILVFVGVGLHRKDFMTSKRIYAVLSILFNIYFISYYLYQDRDSIVLRALENRINHFVYLQNEEDWKDLKMIVEKDNTVLNHFKLSYETKTTVFSFYNGDHLLFSYPTRVQYGLREFSGVSISEESSPSGINKMCFLSSNTVAEREGNRLYIPVFRR